MSKTEFREAVGLSTSTLAKLSANKPVSSDVLAKICDFFVVGWIQLLPIVLTSEQASFLHKIGSAGIKTEIAKCENIANAHYPANAGIIGSTKFHLSGTNLLLEGPFAVIQLLLPWIIKNAQSEWALK